MRYPEDRRFRVWVRPSILVGTGLVVITIFAAAWIQVALADLPQAPETKVSHGIRRRQNYCGSTAEDVSLTLRSQLIN